MGIMEVYSCNARTAGWESCNARWKIKRYKPTQTLVFPHQDNIKKLGVSEIG